MIAPALTPDDMRRRETAKVLEEVTGLKVTILPPDDYGRQFYEFNLAPKDPAQKAGVEGGPFLAGECSDYLQKLTWNAGMVHSPVFIAVQISPKNEWQTAVNLYFSDAGTGFSVPTDMALATAKMLKRGLEEHTKAAYGRVDIGRYQAEALENVHFVDGTERKREI